MAALLKNLLGNIEFDSAIADGEVLSILHKKTSRSLIIQLSLPKRVPYDVLSAAAGEIRTAINAGGVEIYPKYPSSEYGVDAVWDVITFLRRSGENVNGYFDDSEITIGDKTVEIELKSGGGQILTEDGIPAKIRKYTKGFFGVDKEVVFTGKTEIDLAEYNENLAREIAALPVPPPAPAPSAAPAQGGYAPQDRPQKKTYSRDPQIHEPPVTVKLMFSHSSFRDEADLVMGKAINDPPTPMAEIYGDMENVTVWGEIFDRTEKSIKDGQFTIIMLSVTDRTSSQILKVFTKTEKLASYSFFKVGATVLVNGNAKFDNFEKALLIEPRSAMLVKTIAKADTAEVKRV